MPIYDFECRECKHTREKLAKISETTVECPQCGAVMDRVISTGQSFYFKGDGVYSEKSIYPKKKQ